MTNDERWLARVVARITAKGWTQAQLAEKAGVSPNTVSRWVRGHRKASRVYRELIDRTLSKEGKS